ncbi:hypothetical protein [Sulfurovum sp.]|uniref:hypothetical protein n=1 Tax=Sulfurovum sp. TaxID=1969726 RepID=UPI003565E328
MSIGAWFMYEIIDLTQYPFINNLEVLQQLDILVLFYFAYKFKNNNLNNNEKILMLIVIITSLIFAMLSTSKAKLFMVLIPVVLILLQSKRSKLYFIGLFILVLNINVLFDFMMYNRIHNTQSLIDNFIEFQPTLQGEKDTLAVKSNTVLNRLNYQFILARLVKTYPFAPDEFRWKYMDNIIGLIPRFIWPDKPIIGLDQNQIGIEIGVLSRFNTTTAVGITHPGESYYDMGVYGIFIIPFFIAYILVLLSNVFDTRYWMGYLLSFMLSFTLINSTSIGLLPTLLKFFLIFYIFALLLNDRYTDETKIKVK